MKINGKSKILEVLKEHPEAIKVLKHYNLECAGCKGAVEDSIEHICRNNGINLKGFLTELESVVK